MLLLLVMLFLSAGTTGLAQSGVDVAVHYAEGTPAADGNSYNVTVYLSVVDGLGYPILDLTRDAFWLTEDSLDVGVQDVRMIEDEPVNIVLAVDISEGMSGVGNVDIKSAMKAFVSTLKPNDQVAILTFDDKIESQSGFGIDRIASADFIDLIPSYSDTGTCVYDAAHTAVQMASKNSSGNRAVVLLTDGIDQKTDTGAICSVHTVDDVINLASGGGNRTPIFIVELGGLGDSNTLKRMADVTGGLYLHSLDAWQLDNIAEQLSIDLRSQYVLTYQSFAGAGPHTLSIEVDQSGVQAFDTRNFVLPPPPTRIAFTTLQEGQAVGDSLRAEVSLLSQGETVDRVAFEVNGTVVDTDNTEPYELNLGLEPYPAGMITISAIAYGVNNNELTSSTLNLIHSAEAIQPAVVADTPVAIPVQDAPRVNVKPVVLLGVTLGGLGIFTIVLLISMLLHQQRDRRAEEVEEIDNNLFAQAQKSAAVSDVYRTEKVEKQAVPKPDMFGTLLVEASDDSALVGHLFYIITETTTLGRSADNDIPFPKDNPVSRQHAEIFLKGSRLYLRQLQSSDAAGEVRLPKYGTFINQRPVGLDPVLLKTGDEILLGKRVRLKFEAGEALSTLEASTFDDMSTYDDDIDKTQTVS